jgi:hypothetical protein
MVLTDTQLRSQYGLSRSQFDALRRSVDVDARFGDQFTNDVLPRVRHAHNGLSFGAASSTIRLLSNNGYITLELVHTVDEIASLRVRQVAAIENATALLGEGDWKNALAALTTASKLESAIDTRRWKLTDKALQVVAANKD